MHAQLPLSARSSVYLGLACVVWSSACASTTDSGGGAGASGATSTAVGGAAAGGATSTAVGGATSGGATSTAVGGAAAGGATSTAVGGAAAGGATSGGATSTAVGGEPSDSGGDDCAHVECLVANVCLDHCGGSAVATGCCACVPPAVNKNSCGGSANQ